MTEVIERYTPDKREQLEVFRQQTLLEGNESLSMDKFDPDTLQGAIWLAYKDGMIVSMSAAEVSHYTGESTVLRKCRYHILQAHRHGRYGFKFLRKMMTWGKQQGYHTLYWTHDINNRPLNALYQRKRTYAMGHDNAWFYQWPYTKLKFEEDLLFKTGSMYQFVYSIAIDPTVVWCPPQGQYMVRLLHRGDVDLIKREISR